MREQNQARFGEGIEAVCVAEGKNGKTLCTSSTAVSPFCFPRVWSSSILHSRGRQRGPSKWPFQVKLVWMHWFPRTPAAPSVLHSITTRPGFRNTFPSKHYKEFLQTGALGPEGLLTPGNNDKEYKWAGFPENTSKPRSWWNSLLAGPLNFSFLFLEH